MSDFEPLKTSIITGKAEEAEKLAKQALEEGNSADAVLKNVLIPSMGIVGEKMKNNEFFIPEVLIAAKAMKAALSVLKPKLSKDESSSAGKLIIGTVKGDLHDIGKNLVMMMLEGAGFQVIDLGIDVSSDKFVEAAKAENPQLVCMSALLTTTMTSMKTTIDALSAAGMKNKVKILIGGAPITQEYADEIGADGYASDAPSSVDMARELIK